MNRVSKINGDAAAQMPLFTTAASRTSRSADLPAVNGEPPPQLELLRPSHAGASTSDDVIAEIKNFHAFGKETQEILSGGIRYLINEFWTAAQRQSHSIHEISYRACFKAQLPEFFITRLTVPGEAVHDPFMGRGTTPLQAALMGRKPIGTDINPLSILLARPRLQPPSLESVANRLDQIRWDQTAIARPDLLAFYHPETLGKLYVLRRWLLDRAPLSNHSPDKVVDWIRMISLNRLTGHSPGFFSGRTMPPNQAVSVEAQERINHRLGQTPPRRDVVKIILKKSRTLLADGIPGPHPEPLLAVAPAHCCPAIAASSVALVVTSPPFLDIVQYADDNWLRGWFAGIDPKSVEIAMHKTESAWQAMVCEVLKEQARIVRPGGYVAFEVGEVRGGKVLLEQLVWAAAKTLPFERLAVIVNSQDFTKTANCWGVSNGTKGTNTNRVVLLRRA